MTPTIHMSDKNLFIDQPIEITVLGLDPHETFTLKATMRDNFGNDWSSYAQFTSDEQGEIDVAKATPIEGTYEEADVYGLFWSMYRVPNHTEKKRTPLQPLKTTFVFEKDGDELTRSSLTRKLISPHVKRQQIREQNLVGTLFYHPTKESLPTVIVLGGSEGGLMEGTAALLASYGFNTFALAYFGMEHLPKELIHIPIDDVEKAMHWVIDHPNVDSEQIGMMGTSKGGELALVCASMFPEIKAVVGYVPGSVVFPGVAGEMNKSSWTYQGEELAFASGDIPMEVLTKLQKNIQTEGEAIRYRDAYFHWAKGESEATIQVEKINGSVLLISGGDDQLWPADIFSEEIMTRLRNNRHPYSYEHVTYELAGHAFGVPGLPTTESTEVPFFQGKNLYLGGNPKENAAAQRDAWNRVKEFFNINLK